MRQRFLPFVRGKNRDSSKNRGGSSQQEQSNRDAPTTTVVTSTSLSLADVPHTPSPDSTSARQVHPNIPSSPTISARLPTSSSSPLPSEGAQLGLHVIFDSSHRPGHAAEVDFVAVHGLNFNGSGHDAWETWTKDGKLWLRDFLPAVLEGRPIRVMLFDYNSSPALQSAGIKLDDHARSLLQWLRLKRKDVPQRPLVFISHSLGGLLVKQALIEATLDLSYKPIVEASRLLVFFATPHQGGNYARVGDVVARIVTSGQPKLQNDLLDTLKQHSDNVTKRFEQSHHLFNTSLVVNFFEGMPYEPMGIIVDKNSAVLNLPGSREKQIFVNANHNSICKFDSPDDPNCQLVLGTIAQELRRAVEPHHVIEPEPLSKEDKQCLEKLRPTDPRVDKLHDFVCWVRRCQVVLEASIQNVFTDSNKIHAGNFLSELRVWACNNEVFSRTGSFGKCISEEGSVTPMIRATFRNAVVRIVVRLIHGISECGGQPLTGELLCTRQHLEVFDDDPSPEQIHARLSGKVFSPDRGQQDKCLKHARDAFSGLCQLTEAFRIGHPSDPVISHIRAFHDPDSPSSIRGIQGLELILDDQTVKKQLEKHMSYIGQVQIQNHVGVICSRFRAVFAILVSAGLPTRIQRFVRYGVHDEHLPILRVSISHGSRALAVRTLSGNSNRIHLCIQGLNQREVERFDLAQWSILRALESPRWHRRQAEFTSLQLEHELVPFIPEPEPEDPEQDARLHQPAMDSHSPGLDISTTRSSTLERADVETIAAMTKQVGAIAATHVGHSREVENLPQQAQDAGGLGGLLRSFLVPTPSGKTFLPCDALARTVTKDTIQMELESSGTGVLSPSLLGGVVRKICSDGKRLFAVLVLIEKVSDTVMILNGGVSDLDLPLRLVRRRGSRALALCSSSRPQTPLQCFETWSNFSMTSFVEYQWKAIAPVFSLMDMPLEYRLHTEAVLPFTSYGPGAPSPTQPEAKLVTIHPSHHNAPSQISGNKSCFMLKPVASESLYNTELSTLRWLASKKHGHIVSLFASFRRETEFHLIFSYGDQALKDLWSQIANPPIDHTSVIWLMKQCRGLTSALSLIHKSDHLSDKPFGRLQSLRPEQIRHFQAPDEQSVSKPSWGTLKIADVEEVTFHSKFSRTVRHTNRFLQVSPYRSPEHESHGTLSQKSDLWALGCLFLEMITWFLCGKKGLDKFAQKRRILVGMRATDSFFTLHRSASGQNQGDSTVSTINSGVVEWFNHLRRYPPCTEAFHRFLDVVQYEMLRPIPDERTTIDELVDQLEALEHDCRKDLIYCTRPVPWQTPTVSVDPRLSPLMSLQEALLTPSEPETTKPRVEVGSNFEIFDSFGNGRLSTNEGLRFSQIIQMGRVFDPNQIFDSLASLLGSRKLRLDAGFDKVRISTQRPLGPDEVKLVEEHGKLPIPPLQMVT